jgi:hypothetical protein
VGDYTGAQTVIFRGIFSIYYSADETSEAAMGGAWLGAGKGDIIFFRVPISLEGCDGWDGGGGGRGGGYYFDHGGPVERHTPLAARLRA